MRSFMAYKADGTPVVGTNPLAVAREAGASPGHDGLLTAAQEALTALLYHVGGNLSPDTATSAIRSLRAAIRAAKARP